MSGDAVCPFRATVIKAGEAVIWVLAVWEIALMIDFVKNKKQNTKEGYIASALINWERLQESSGHALWIIGVLFQLLRYIGKLHLPISAVNEGLSDKDTCINIWLSVDNVMLYVQINVQLTYYRLISMIWFVNHV